MRRIVVCLDGTWNNAEMAAPTEDGRKRFHPTNVLKTYRAVVPVAPDGSTQIAYYSEGVGSLVGEPIRFGRLHFVIDRLVGGAFGGGFEARVKEAYRFLVGNFQPGDQIFVFGFSRGSAQAQSLVRFMDWTGGLLLKGDEYYIPELWDSFRSTRAREGAAMETIAGIRSRRPGDPNAIRDPQVAPVTFLGVYDTVLAVGSRLVADRTEGKVVGVHPRYGYHVGESPPPNVQRARHALSINEVRWDYRALVWERPGAPSQDLEQRWFAGVHTQVGGGRSKGDGFANVPLRWMTSEARAAGLAVDEAYLRKFKGWMDAEQVEGEASVSKLIASLRGRRGQGVRALERGPEDKTSVDLSALRLMLRNDAYRPKNLLTYLRAHPVALEGLNPDEQARMAGLLKDAP